MNLLYVLLLKSTCLNLNPGPKFWNQNRTRIATMVRTMRLAVKILSVHVAASITWSHISFTFHGSCYKKLVRFINAKNSWLHMSMIKLFTYSQTSKVTTSQPQPTVWNPNFSFYNVWTTTTCQQRQHIWGSKGCLSAQLWLQLHMFKNKAFL